MLWLAVILLLGVGAQWLAWWLRLPSILVLLGTGLTVGPVARWLTPLLFGRTISLDVDQLVGTDLLLSLVSLAVGLILFEGGLSLNFRAIVGVRRVVWLLVTVGALVTWSIAALSGKLLLGLRADMAVLLGAVLIVTGPTVIGPLLRHIRPTGQSGSVLRWEGIVIDPIGAMIAVLAFEAIASGKSVLPGVQFVATAGSMVQSALATTLCGVAVGALAAGLIVLLLSRFMVPDHLQVAVVLTGVIAALNLSNLIVHESGLFTATIMGVMLANQRRVIVRHIVEFKETLTILLVGMLFVVLAARVEVSALREMRLATILFILSLVLVARPLAVLCSSAGSKLTWRERAFVAWMAPRGIVAAAVASVFSLRLKEQNAPQASVLVPYVFLVIICTVTLYGLTGAWVARRLGLARSGNGGFLIIGADRLARELGQFLTSEGIEVLMVDTNNTNVRDARLAGVPALVANALGGQVAERIELSGIDRLLAMTPNDEVNTLAAVHYGKIFGRSSAYQLAERSRIEPTLSTQKTHQELTGRTLFRPDMVHDALLQRLDDGAKIHKTKITSEFDYSAYQQRQGANAIPLFIVSETGELTPVTTDTPPAPRPGQSIIALVAPAQGAGTASAVVPQELAIANP